MNKCYKKNKYVRILSQPDSDIELDKIYINSNFKFENQTYSGEELIYRIREGKNVVITGNAGSGKTFFMRHLWLNFFDTNVDFTPIFIELRQLNSCERIDLFEFIRKSIFSHNEITDDLFKNLCKNGSFYCLFFWLKPSSSDE